jgi:hypothetical protein
VQNDLTLEVKGLIVMCVALSDSKSDKSTIEAFILRMFPNTMLHEIQWAKQFQLVVKNDLTSPILILNSSCETYTSTRQSSAWKFIPV